MRHVDIRNATVEWLDTHVAKFPGMARHVPRNLQTAQGLYLSESLEIPFSKVAIQPEHGHIVMDAPETLDRQTLRLLIQTVILFEGRTYGFAGLSPESDEKPAGHSPRRWIQIRFTPT